MANILDRYQASTKQKALVLDGGFGTELARLGKDLGQDDLWSARILKDDPKAVERVHEAYYKAGADIATTSSYQASFEAFERSGISESESAGLLRRSVEVAVQARDAVCKNESRPAPLVAFSCGSYGAARADGSEYSGSFTDDVTDEQLLHFHQRRLEAVAHTPGIDLLAFETVPCLKELRAIARLLQVHSPGPAWVSMSCKDGLHTNHGESLAKDCLPVALLCRDLVAVGVNCTPPKFVKQLLQSSRDVISSHPGSVRLLAYPNSGEGWDAASDSWMGDPDLQPQEFGDAAADWVASGASMVGGCCRTTPEHIKAIARAIK